MEYKYKSPDKSTPESFEKYCLHLIDRLQNIGKLEDEQLQPDAPGTITAQRLFVDSIVSRMITDLSDMVVSPLESIRMTIANRQEAWETKLRRKFQHHEEALKRKKSKLCEITHEKSYPWFSLIDQVRQNLRHNQGAYSDKENQHKLKKRLEMMELLIESVDNGSLSLFDNEFSTEKETKSGYPIPHFIIPDKVSKGLKMLAEGLQEIKMKVNYWNPLKSFVPRPSDWFSEEKMDLDSQGEWFYGTLLRNVEPNGCFTLQMQSPSTGSPSTSELLWFISERLRYKIVGGHPSVTRMNLTTGVHAFTRAIVYLGNETSRGLIVQNFYDEESCVVQLMDFGLRDRYFHNQIYIDNDPDSELYTFPPLSIECSFLAPNITVQHEDVQALNSAFSDMTYYENKFMFQVVDCHNLPNGIEVRQIYISEEIDRIAKSISKKSSWRNGGLENWKGSVGTVSNSEWSDSRNSVKHPRVPNRRTLLQTPQKSMERSKSRFRNSDGPHQRPMMETMKTKFRSLIATEGMSHFVRSCMSVAERKCPSMVKDLSSRREQNQDITNASLSDISCDGDVMPISTPKHGRVIDVEVYEDEDEDIYSKSWTQTLSDRKSKRKVSLQDQEPRRKIGRSSLSERCANYSLPT